jgi:hypothetical protein
MPATPAELADWLRHIITGDPSEAERIAFEHELRQLSPNDRAVIAARVANCRRDQAWRWRTDQVHKDRLRHPRKNVTLITLDEAAAAAQVSRSMVCYARTVFDHGTPTEIREIEAGTAKVGTLGKRIRKGLIPAEIRAIEGGAVKVRTLGEQIRKGLSSAERRRLANEPVNQRGGNIGRIADQRLNGLIWRWVRSMVEPIRHLPHPHSAEAIVHATGKGGLIDAKIALGNRLA